MHFPFSVIANIESTPALGDIDNDGNYELAVATTMGLKVIDIKTEYGEALSWETYRGNHARSGSLGATLLFNNSTCADNSFIASIHNGIIFSSFTVKKLFSVPDFFV